MAKELFSYPAYLLLGPTTATQFSLLSGRPLSIPRPATGRASLRRLKVRSSLQELEPVARELHQNHESLFLLAADTVGYSTASYYTSLGLFVISVPGLWSLIKRSVKSKIVQRTFIGEGEEKKVPNRVAGEILSFFTRNNFSVTGRGETITFEGVMVPSRGQAALLTFCTCISLASVALVLTITLPDFGNNWFWITALSPLAGAYYWKRASRTEQIKVKMIVGDDGKLTEIIVQGDDQQDIETQTCMLILEFPEDTNSTWVSLYHPIFQCVYAVCLKALSWQAKKIYL
ncbi:hypothetical protein SAY86_001592 [Trapa natans]|uniref:Protein COFACTOR ASSEMBLY OF COMPLEX C SUBUNIT B CCB1, chloroplastic n=1 Tax=Trapa natans TaxID=22666 RepID=A0AAN7LBS3_TRANT|nr:hypothetical protein SAY86_001592 [Trapa natans]